MFGFWRKRLIVYGDIHGCLDELKSLRQQLAPKNGDIEVSLGDIINKGPYSKELIEYLSANNIRAIFGNHEDKFLRYRHFELSKTKKNPVVLSNSQQKIYDSLEDTHFDYLSSMSHFFRFGKVTLIHAGLTNVMNIDELSKKDMELIMHIRWLDKKFHFVSIEETKSKGEYFWADVYDGSSGFIVYGHQPFREVKVNTNALGIDTGCAYGNKLTAAIFYQTNGSVDNLEYKLVQVESKDTYAQKDDWL
jgi:hypothetical protein